jgi:hypothetical protein
MILITRTNKPQSSRSFLSQWSVSVLFVLLSCFAHAEQSQLSKTIDAIRNYAGPGGKLIKIGTTTSSLGVSAAGTAAFLGPKAGKFIAQKTVDKVTKVAFTFARGGLIISGTGAVIAFLSNPSTVASGTLSEHYMTAEGFKEFLKLPKESQMFYAKSDPVFETFLTKVADGIEQVEKFSSPDYVSPKAVPASSVHSANQPPPPTGTTK